MSIIYNCSIQIDRQTLFQSKAGENDFNELSAFENTDCLNHSVVFRIIELFVMISFLIALQRMRGFSIYFKFNKSM